MTEFAGIGLLFLLYVAIVEPLVFAVRRYRITVPSTLVQPVTLVFLSDLHAGANPSWVYRQLSRKLVTIFQEDGEKIMVLGGDQVDRKRSALSQLDPVLQIAKKHGVPVYAVVGNHEIERLSGQLQEYRQELEGKGVRLLRNEAVTVETESGPLVLIGLDDLETDKGYGALLRGSSSESYITALQHISWLREFDTFRPELPRIVISHNPDGALLPAGVKPHVILSGHTHGGQIVFLPLLAPLLNRELRWSPYPKGSFGTQAGKRTGIAPVIISRGIGGSTLPFRLGSRPEIVSVTLTPERQVSETVDEHGDGCRRHDDDR